MTRRMATVMMAVLVGLTSRLFASESQLGASLPARVTLDQVLQLLNDRSPRTAAERATVDVVAADRITAGTLPNPTISYGGVSTLQELRTKFWADPQRYLIRLSQASRTESFDR